MNNKAILAGGVAGLLLVAVVALVGFNSEAGETVLIRGIVKSGGDSGSISVFYTHVITAADPSQLQGLVRDVDVSKATKYKWVQSGGSLVKKKASSNPTPEKEVVFKGTLRDDLRVNAAWIVENYRQFTMDGTVQGRSLDTGKTDEGWLTINVTGLTMRDVTPTRTFKEAQFKSKDVQVRFNGLSTFTALGKSKQADEVTASQQKITINGEMIDEDTFVISTANEHN